MKKITVLITGAGGGNNGGQILEALRLAITPYNIVATNTDPNTSGIFRADVGYLVPNAAEKAYLPTLLKICKKEKIQAIFPGSEPELAVISQHRDEFIKADVLPMINTVEVIETCQDKAKTAQFFKENNLYFPKSAILTQPKLPSGFKYPLVLKPVKGGSGSKNVLILQSDRELKFYFENFRAQKLRPMIQEYIGTAEN